MLLDLRLASASGDWSTSVVQARSPQPLPQPHRRAEAGRVGSPGPYAVLSPGWALPGGVGCLVTRRRHPNEWYL